jgi:hypothetical protein
MEAFQEAFDGLRRDITGHEILEVFQDLGITILELALCLFAAIFPPVLSQFGEEGFLETSIWEIPSFGNLGLALPQPLRG